MPKKGHRSVYPGKEMTASWSGQDQLQKIAGLIRVGRGRLQRGRWHPQRDQDEQEVACREPSRGSRNWLEPRIWVDQASLQPDCAGL